MEPASGRSRRAFGDSSNLSIEGIVGGAAAPPWNPSWSHGPNLRNTALSS